MFEGKRMKLQRARGHCGSSHDGPLSILITNRGSIVGAREEMKKAAASALRSVLEEGKATGKTTPQDNIIEALEAEIVRLKAQLSDTEDRLSKVKEKCDEMAIKLYGGNRNR